MVTSQVHRQLSCLWLALTAMVIVHVVDSSQVHGQLSRLSSQVLGQLSRLWLALISAVSFHVHGQLSPVVSSCSWSVCMPTVSSHICDNLSM